MSLLKVLIPETVVAIVILEIEHTSAMLSVLYPVTVIAFTVGEGVHSSSIAFAFSKFALVSIAVVEHYASFAMRTVGYDFTLILPYPVLFPEGERTDGYLLCVTCGSKKNKNNCQYIFISGHDMVGLYVGTKVSVLPDVAKCVDSVKLSSHFRHRGSSFAGSITTR